MDFLKTDWRRTVSFDHQEAVPWTFTRLNIAGESTEVMPSHAVDVGVAMFATERLKKWSRMDNTVGTFESAKLWLQLMKPIMPIPVLVVGLDAAEYTSPWEEVSDFRGTARGTRSVPLDEAGAGG